MHEDLTRGRQPFRHDDVNVRPRAEAEKKEPDILRMLAQDYKRSQRAQSLPLNLRISEYKTQNKAGRTDNKTQQDRAVQTDENPEIEQRARSLPPDFKISGYKTRNKVVQTDNKTQQDRAVQTDENSELEQRAQLVVADLKKRVQLTQSRDTQTDITYSEYKTQDKAVQTDENSELEQRAQLVVADLKKRVQPTQSRDAQTDITYHAQDYEKKYETLEQRAQVLHGHFSSDTADGGTSSMPPPDFLPWHLETIAEQETRLAEAQDKQIQNFAKKAETSPLYKEHLNLFQASIQQQKEARTQFSQDLQNLRNDIDSSRPQWETHSMYLDTRLRMYQEGIVDNDEALACAALEKPELTPDEFHAALDKVRVRMKPLSEAISTLRQEPNGANLLIVADEWKAFSKDEIARSLPATTLKAKL